ncbi:hypothetical protein VKT23_011626 [Stygiomarasmius scandens]|uniref:Myb-like domain-containing protein n=1 Tax=Marasmiellus scandens TaxID=2682957 RepID=A0ABR1JCP4_9AGAR
MPKTRKKKQNTTQATRKNVTRHSTHSAAIQDPPEEPNPPSPTPETTTSLPLRIRLRLPPREHSPDPPVPVTNAQATPAPVVPAVSVQPPLSGTGNADWTESDCDRLLAYLEAHKSVSENSKGFKKSFWVNCAVHMNQTRTSGGPKTHASCRSKWQREFIAPYNLIIKLLNTSGLKNCWDPETGISIPLPPHDMVNAWETFVAQNPEIVKYENGWKYFCRVEALMPASNTRKFVYLPSQGTSLQEDEAGLLAQQSPVEPSQEEGVGGLGELQNDDEDDEDIDDSLETQTLMSFTSTPAISCKLPDFNCLCHYSSSSSQA